MEMRWNGMAFRAFAPYGSSTFQIWPLYRWGFNISPLCKGSILQDVQVCRLYRSGSATLPLCRNWEFGNVQSYRKDAKGKRVKIGVRLRTSHTWISDEEPTLTIWSLIKPFGRCNCSTIQQIHRVKDQWYKMISSNIVRRIKSSSHSAGTSMLCRRPMIQ
nr:hypothetical protein CFP56_64210 [Quercus suber]